MNALQRTMQRLVKGLFGVSFGTAGADSFEFAQLWERGLPTETTGKVTEPFRQDATIALAVSIVSLDAAAIGWELYGEQDENPIEEHPILDLLDRPSTMMTGHQLFSGSFMSFKLFGEAWWYYPTLELGRRGGLAATETNRGGIMLLDPRAIRLDEQGRWVLRGAGGIDEVLDQDKLTQFKRFNPYNAARGLSEVASVMSEIDADFSAANWNRRFFSDQNGVPTGLLIPSKPGEGGFQLPVNEEERERYLKRFTLRHSGRRGIGVLPAGWSWQDLSMSMRDMDFRALREYSREQKLAMMGVPPFLAGVLDKANYANAREQKEVYWLGTITRLLTQFQETLNYDFLPKIGADATLELWPAYEKVKALVENLKEKTEIAAAWFAIGLPKSVINERLEMGWDDTQIEDYETGYLPFGLAPISSMNEPRTPMGPGQPPEDDEDDAEAEVERQMSKLDRERFRESRRALVWRNLVVRTRDLEQSFSRTIRRHVEQIRAEVFANLDTLKAWLAVQRQSDDGFDLFDIEESKKRLQDATAPIHRMALVRGGESLIAEIAAALSFTLDDPLAIAKLAELSHKITRIDDTIEAALRDSLVEGLVAGESPQELARRVRDVMDASTSRSLTIARTEVGFAFNTGRNLGMKQAGVTQQEWLTARDSKVRDTHKALDGQVRGIGEAFSNGLLYPQDPSGPPGEIINCRCVALPVVE